MYMNVRMYDTVLRLRMYNVHFQALCV